MTWWIQLITGALGSVGFSLLPLVASILTGNRAAKAEKAVSDRNEVYTSTLRDCLAGFSVVKSFRAEAEMLRMFRENVRSLAAAQCKKHKMLQENGI